VVVPVAFPHIFVAGVAEAQVTRMVIPIAALHLVVALGTNPSVQGFFACPGDFGLFFRCMREFRILVDAATTSLLVRLALLPGRVLTVFALLVTGIVTSHVAPCRWRSQ